MGVIKCLAKAAAALSAAAFLLAGCNKPAPAEEETARNKMGFLQNECVVFVGEEVAVPVSYQVFERGVYVKADYDFVIIDCPPVEIVADTQIIERCCDRTLFVVRAGLLDRGMLPELEALYLDGRLKNMSMILNGSSSSGSSRYGYHYGYKYGYHAGSHGYYGSEHKD